MVSAGLGSLSSSQAGVWEAVPGQPAGRAGVGDTAPQPGHGLLGSQDTSHPSDLVCFAVQQWSIKDTW